MAEEEIKISTSNEYTQLINSETNSSGLKRQKSRGTNPPSLTRRMSSQFLSAIDTTSSSTNFFSDVPNNIVNAIPGFSRQKSHAMPTYFCNICFTKYPIKEGYKLQNCQHLFCRECIAGYFTNKISDGVVKLKCFYPESNESKTEPKASCSTPINEDDIHAIVTAETWQKYNKFKANVENSLSRQCPYCDNTQIGNIENPIITCNNTQCNKQYCLYHASAHPMSELCEQYELRTAKETKMNEMVINKMGDGVKPCPQCKFRIVKNGGCNHMNCVKCGCSFCWLCMEIIENTELPNHYKDSASKCNGKQFEGMESELQPPKWILCLLYIFACTLCIPSLLLAIIFRIICLPCYCVCKCVGNQTDAESQNFLSLLCSQNISGCCFIWLIILSIPLLIVLSVPLFIIYCFCSIIKRIYIGCRICCSNQKPFGIETDLNIAKAKVLARHEDCYGICTVGIIENKSGYVLQQKESTDYAGKMVASPPEIINDGEYAPFIHSESGCVLYDVLHNEGNQPCQILISWIIDSDDNNHEIDYEIIGNQAVNVHVNVTSFHENENNVEGNDAPQFIWTITCDSEKI